MKAIFIGNFFFHKIPLYFRLYADFECDNQVNTSCIGNKLLTNIDKILCVMVII